MNGYQNTYIGYEKDGFKQIVKYNNIKFCEKSKRWRNYKGEFVTPYEDDKR